MTTTTRKKLEARDRRRHGPPIADTSDRDLTLLALDPVFSRELAPFVKTGYSGAPKILAHDDGRGDCRNMSENHRERMIAKTSAKTNPARNRAHEGPQVAKAQKAMATPEKHEASSRHR